MHPNKVALTHSSWIASLLISVMLDWAATPHHAQKIERFFQCTVVFFVSRYVGLGARFAASRGEFILVARKPWPEARLLCRRDLNNLFSDS
jgi:hypothetical protein